MISNGTWLKASSHRAVAPPPLHRQEGERRVRRGFRCVCYKDAKIRTDTVASLPQRGGRNADDGDECVHPGPTHETNSTTTGFVVRVFHAVHCRQRQNPACGTDYEGRITSSSEQSNTPVDASTAKGPITSNRALGSNYSHGIIV